MVHRYHRLKSWPVNMEPIIEGRTVCSIRKADRDYREGDYLHLEEWDPRPNPKTGGVPVGYTGKVRIVRVTHIDQPPLLAPVGEVAVPPAKQDVDRVVVLSFQQAPGGLPSDAVEVPPGDFGAHQ